MSAALFLTPEHLHVMVNHIPLIGLGAAVIPLGYALIRKDRTAFILGFLMCFIFGACIGLVAESGDAAYDRFQDGPLKGLLDKEGREAMYAHMDAADFAVPFIYAEGGLGLLGLIAVWKFRRAIAPFGWTALVGALVCIGLMARVAAYGGQIRHPEFRHALLEQAAPARPIAPGSSAGG